MPFVIECHVYCFKTNLHILHYSILVFVYNNEVHFVRIIRKYYPFSNVDKTEQWNFSSAIESVNNEKL